MMEIPIVLQDDSVSVHVTHFRVVCPTCGTRDPEVGSREARRLGKEAAQTIYRAVNIGWYDALLEQLAKQDPVQFRRALARANATH